MDPITKYILEVEVKDDPDKAVDTTVKSVEKIKKDTEDSTKGLQNMPMPTESRIDKITYILLENGCKKGLVWNSVKKKCVKNPPYDEEEDEDISGAFAGKRNATDPKKNEQGSSS